jgi:hypothetical protein
MFLLWQARQRDLGRLVLDARAVVALEVLGHVGGADWPRSHSR